MPRSTYLFALLASWLLLVVAVDGVELEGFAEDEEDTVAEVTTNVDPELFEEVHSTERPSETHPDGATTELPNVVWDADEFEGFDEVPVVHEAIPEADKPPLRRRQSIWKKQESYTRELIALALLVIYLANVWIGKTVNESIALAWAHAFVSDGAVFEKNFAWVGADDEEGDVFIKETHAQFKFYASGRRYCQGMLASLDLKSRQDLISVGLSAVISKSDTLDIDVYMNEADMGPMVVLLASPKHVKYLLRENEDIRIYAREIPVKQIPKWPLDKVHVWTESPDVFYDLMVPEVKKLFLSSEFEAVDGKYFRYLYMTSDYSKGTHKKVIKFSFNLPEKDKMVELARWMALVPLLIDLVAEYVPSNESKKRAEKHRALESERLWREGAEERKEAFQQKKAEEQLAEMERIRRLPPEEQQKWMEKQQKLKQRRSMKVKTLRA